MDILKSTKDVLEDRYSLYHSAITFTNAFANCGTTSDRFIRENLDWLGRASNWAKFSATASLGLIHRGSWVNGRKVVKPYLPGGSAPNKFSEGGALFALGLIYAGRKEKAEAELRKGIQETNDPVVQHGAALGLGVSALATADEGEYIRDLTYSGLALLDLSRAGTDEKTSMKSSKPPCSRTTPLLARPRGTPWALSCSALPPTRHTTRC
jgi:26S proteasome regulatory subunit N2